MAERSFADRLKAAGESFAGRGNQYRQSQAAAALYDERAEAERQQRLSEMEDYRKQAFIQDAQAARMMVENGRPDLAQGFLQQRMQIGSRLGLDMKDTQAGLQMLESGDTESFMQTTGAILSQWEQAQQKGSDWRPMAPKSSGNQMIVETAPGQFESRPIAGYIEPPEEPDFDPEAQRKYKQDARNNISALRKGFRDTEVAYSKLQSARSQKNPVGDLALTIQVMKLLDPNSVVRESEQGMVVESASVPQRVLNAFDAAAGRGTLSEDQRQDILRLADDFYADQRLATDESVFEQLQFIEADKMDIANVLGEQRARRWKEKRYEANGVRFSLFDIFQTAQEEGKRPADVMRDLELDIRSGRAQ